MSLHHPESVAAAGQNKLHLEFADGVQGEVDLSHLAGKGVFAPLADPAVFASVAVGAHGELVWPGGLDICSDALYLQLASEDRLTATPSASELPCPK